MRLLINGATRELPEGLDGAALLKLLGLPGATLVAELNQQVLSSAAFQATELHDGDVLELVTVVGGG